MNNEMRMVKFETFIRDINEKIRNKRPFTAIQKLNIFTAKQDALNNQAQVCNNPSLLLIYDYEQLNEYGKIIIQQSDLDLKDWDSKYLVINSLKDSKKKIDAAKELVSYCRKSALGEEGYKFIFWAMMVLTVDKTDGDEKLSLICDFAKMLKVTDEEMLDILQVIKVLYHEENQGFKFKTEMVQVHFSGLLNLYN